MRPSFIVSSERLVAVLARVQLGEPLFQLLIGFCDRFLRGHDLRQITDGSDDEASAACVSLAVHGDIHRHRFAVHAQHPRTDPSGSVLAECRGDPGSVLGDEILLQIGTHDRTQIGLGHVGKALVAVQHHAVGHDVDRAFAHGLDHLAVRLFGTAQREHQLAARRCHRDRVHLTGPDGTQRLFGFCQPALQLGDLPPEALVE